MCGRCVIIFSTGHIDFSPATNNAWKKKKKRLHAVNLPRVERLNIGTKVSHRQQALKGRRVRFGST